MFAFNIDLHIMAMKYSSAWKASCLSMLAQLQYSPTTISHMCDASHTVATMRVLSMERAMITCKSAFSRGLQSMRNSYMHQLLHTYFPVLSVCESRLVTQFYKNNATSAIVGRNY